MIRQAQFGKWIVGTGCHSPKLQPFKGRWALSRELRVNEAQSTLIGGAEGNRTPDLCSAMARAATFTVMDAHIYLRILDRYINGLISFDLGSSVCPDGLK